MTVWKWGKKIGLLLGWGWYRCASKRKAIFLASFSIVSWTSQVGTHNHRWQMTTSKCGFNQTCLFDPAIYFNESWQRKRKSIPPFLKSPSNVVLCLRVHFGRIVSVLFVLQTTLIFCAFYSTITFWKITLALYVIVSAITKQFYSTGASGNDKYIKTLPCLYLAVHSSETGKRQ